jgi:hypothetical protein
MSLGTQVSSKPWSWFPGLLVAADVLVYQQLCSALQLVLPNQSTLMETNRQTPLSADAIGPLGEGQRPLHR